VLAGVLLTLAGAGGVGALLWTYGQDLPEIHNVQDYRPTEVTRVVAADGTVIATLIDEDAIVRTVVSWDDIPQVMRDAILAAEDAGFYSHPGLDVIGLARAMITNIRRGRLSQGASTITQQVVKNLVLSPERSIRRKVQEAILAFRLEERLTKDEILTIYLNEVFFGSRYYGVEEAARYYFGHGAATLSLEEAALLAGLVQSPNRYNPFRHPERALQRRSYVLRQMWEKGFIEESRYREADEAPLALDATHGQTEWENAFPYYVDAVRRELLERLPPEQIYGMGLVVETPLDIELQAITQDALRAGLRAFDARHGYHTPYRQLESDDAVADWRAEYHGDVATLGLRSDRDYRAVVLEHREGRVRLGVGPVEAILDTVPDGRVVPEGAELSALFPLRSVFTVRAVRDLAPEALSDATWDERVVRMLPSAEGAAVVIEPTSREVVALAGGYDFEASSFNRAVQAQRQVGSAFKPFVYGAALDARVITPATVMLDQPVTFPMGAGQTWQPRNYDGRFDGPMSIRRALARSRNVIAVRVLDVVGRDRAEAFARAAGITSAMPDNLTMALGSAELSPLEATNGFATFAAGGFSGRPVLIRRIRHADGSVLWSADAELTAAISPDVAWLTTSLMRSVVEEGTATRARAVGHEVAGKTGTTNGARDAWFIGFSRQLVAGVWVGRDDNEGLGRGENGGATALPIWVDLMTRAHANREPRAFPDPPPGVDLATVDPASGLLARPGQGGTAEYFLRGTAPTDYAPEPTQRGVDDVLLRGSGGGEGLADDAPVEDGF
jgi:penicillin-binding protein 1A